MIHAQICTLLNRYTVLTTLTNPNMEQSVVGSYDNIPITHLHYIVHAAHVTSWYRSQLLEITVVQHHDTSAATATPELLVGDAHGVDEVWKLYFCLFHPLLLSGRKQAVAGHFVGLRR